MPTRPQSLSQRGQDLIGKPLRADFAYFHEVEEDPFHPADNPDGKIALCIAENVVSWPEMEARLREAACAKTPDWVAKYTAVTGAPEFRSALAGFAERHLTTLGGQPAQALDPESFCVSSGATGVVELTALLLADTEDVAAFPAPCYPVYTKDIGLKAGMLRYDIEPAAGWAGAGGIHPLHVSDLERARGDIHEGGRTLRMVVLTQPDNPTGAIYTRDQLEGFAAWAARHRVHLCVNELYALSQVDTTDARIAADYSAEREPYFSFLHLVERQRSPYLHWWYSVSKDFGLSGLRCGMMYTRNAALVQAFGNYGAPHTVSNHTQWLLTQVLSDDAFVTAFAKANQARLTDAYARVVSALRQNGIAYVPARGSLFVWARLNAEGRATDKTFWQKMYEEMGVLLTAPGDFGHSEAGWLRVVYSCVESAALDVAVRRVLGQS